jgi:hypothetical protein
MAMGLAYACAARYLNIYAAFERPLCTHSCVWRLQLLKRNADQWTTSVISKFLFVRIHYRLPSFAFDTISSIQFHFRHDQGLHLAASGSKARRSCCPISDSVVFGFQAVFYPRPQRIFDILYSFLQFHTWRLAGASFGRSHHRFRSCPLEPLRLGWLPFRSLLHVHNCCCSAIDTLGSCQVKIV